MYDCRLPHPPTYLPTYLTTHHTYLPTVSSSPHLTNSACLVADFRHLKDTAETKGHSYLADAVFSDDYLAGLLKGVALVPRIDFDGGSGSRSRHEELRYANALLACLCCEETREAAFFDPFPLTNGAARDVAAGERARIAQIEEAVTLLAEAERSAREAQQQVTQTTL